MNHRRTTTIATLAAGLALCAGSASAQPGVEANRESPRQAADTRAVPASHVSLVGDAPLDGPVVWPAKENAAPVYWRAFMLYV
ncbi:MAG: hypothetical protein KDA32_14300, partial [Phycisphaerales bacterium]|nr:hypothetical protein [Phycisphaerales bacterium]